MPKMGEEKDEGGGSSFTLKNAGQGFEGRSTDIFGQLDVLEKKHISHEQSRTDLDDFANLERDEDDYRHIVDKTSISQRKFRQTKDDDTQQCKGDIFGVPQRDAELDMCSDELGHPSSTRRKGERHLGRRQPQFRRPSGRAPVRFRSRDGRVPDHGNKPHNWTHYSLEDVKGSDMSEKSNTQAALAFLEEQRKLKAEEAMEEEEAFDVGSAACSKGMFSFAKRNKTQSSDDKLGKKALPGADSVEKSDRLLASTAKVAESDKEADTVDEEKVELSSPSAKDHTVQAGFKSRKGIKRSIRSRDDDD